MELPGRDDTTRGAGDTGDTGDTGGVADTGATGGAAGVAEAAGATVAGAVGWGETIIGGGVGIAAAGATDTTGATGATGAAGAVVLCVEVAGVFFAPAVTAFFAAGLGAGGSTSSVATFFTRLGLSAIGSRFRPCSSA